MKVYPMPTRDQTHNFNAGPAALPLDVLKRAQAELVSYPQAGMSVLEMSHRSATFGSIIDAARQRIIDLYAVPESHEVLFLQGGASLQFAMVPLNLGEGGVYLNTGTWSTRAINEAKTIGEAHEIWRDTEGHFQAVPQGEIDISEEHLKSAPYLHYTSNNTIYGTQYKVPPQLRATHQPPLVADLSSDFLSRPLDVRPFDVIYAGAQKNAGPSGLTVLIIRKEISRRDPINPRCPIITRYRTHAEKDSMYNTPNTFGIYLLGLVAEWVIDQGGLEAMRTLSAEKSAMIYSVIDAHHQVYQGYADPESRSEMNITFRLTDPTRESELLSIAQDAGIVGLKGHRSVGGLRASLYNAVPKTSVAHLAEVLDRFARS